MTERIAALREVHQKLDDFEDALQQITMASGDAAAALAGLGGSLLGTFDALHKGYARVPFSLEGFEIGEVIISVGFLVWLLLAIAYSLRGKTSLKYLAELYPEPGKSNVTPQQ